MQMGEDTMVCGKLDLEKVLEHLVIKMDLSMKGNGSKISDKEEGYTLMLMEYDEKENMIRIKK